MRRRTVPNVPCRLVEIAVPAGVRLGLRGRKLRMFFSSRRRHTRLQGDWSSDVCSSDLGRSVAKRIGARADAYAPDLLSVIGNTGTANVGVALADALDRAGPDQLVLVVLLEIGRASCRERG